MSEINWNEMGNFITLEAGTPKRLVLKNWRQQTKFKDQNTNEIKFGISFDVYKDDNFEFDETTKKDWTVTAIKACAQLKPIIEKAAAAGKDSLTLSVLKAGAGNKTVYTITEVPTDVAQAAVVPPVAPAVATDPTQVVQ